MLKFIFLILLLVNGGLFAYHQGHLDGLLPVSREPARLAQQMNADKIHLLPAPGKPVTPQPVAPADHPAASPAAGPASQATPVDAAAMPAVAMAAALPAPLAANAAAAKAEDAAKKADSDQPAEADKKPVFVACLELGNFNEVDAGRVESRLGTLVPGARLSRRVIREVSSHMVMMPPQGSKENADRKVDQLRSLGVTDFYVIQDQSEMRWGISLGIFSSEEAASKRLEQLKQQGVRTARIVARNAVSKVAFQLRELDAAGRTRLDGLKTDFPQQQQRKCA
ncbi:SPOR domain-containing protein [Janthinobacterium sp. 17J80-10]|uniref:SPOR domain-containing protein n=1 Tax=Janthinobacterium sp. 17J80-10 TaxID=2497863 RepID=UPI00100548CF|nr:SPOR domain-containing protein [Janthinobacterium sp. 17J80-10]QAU33244.1 SPOR domain-containing protein [Janthinobacterium sp. 17J80-10]